MVSMFALCREATISFSTPFSSSILTRAFFVGLLFSFFMISIIGIFRGESRNILCNFCGNAVDKFFKFFLTPDQICVKIYPGGPFLKKTKVAFKNFTLALAEVLHSNAV